MTSIEQIAARYDALKPPADMTVTTGPEESEAIGTTQDLFFENIISSLGVGQRATAAFFQVTHYMLVPPFISAADFRATDANVMELWLSGVQPLATVKNQRDDINHQVVQFTKHTLQRNALERLSQIVDIG